MRNARVFFSRVLRHFLREGLSAFFFCLFFPPPSVFRDIEEVVSYLITRSDSSHAHVQFLDTGAINGNNGLQIATPLLPVSYTPTS